MSCRAGSLIPVPRFCLYSGPWWFVVLGNLVRSSLARSLISIHLILIPLDTSEN